MIGRATNKHYLLFTGAHRFRRPRRRRDGHGRDDDHRHRARRRPGPAHGRRRQGPGRPRGKPMVAHVLERLAPQVDDVLINANQNLERYARVRLSGRRRRGRRLRRPARRTARRADARDARRFVVTVPCDSPFLPRDLVARLRAALERDGARLAVAKTGRPAASGVRAGAPRRAAASRRVPRAAADARSTRGTRRCASVEVAVRRRGRRVPQHQHRRRTRGRGARPDRAPDSNRSADSHRSSSRMTQPKTLREASCADDYDPNSMPVDRARALIRTFLDAGHRDRARPHPRTRSAACSPRTSSRRSTCPATTTRRWTATRCASPISRPTARRRSTRVGESFAGKPQRRRRSAPGQCVRIFTGGVMPRGRRHRRHAGARDARTAAACASPPGAVDQGRAEPPLRRRGPQARAGRVPRRAARAPGGARA